MGGWSRPCGLLKLSLRPSLRPRPRPSLSPLSAHEMMMRWNATDPGTRGRRRRRRRGSREWRFRGVTPWLCYNVASKRTRKCMPILEGIALYSSLAGGGRTESIERRTDADGFYGFAPFPPLSSLFALGRLTRLKVMNMVILVIAQLAAAAATPHIHAATTYYVRRCNLAESDGCQHCRHGQVCGMAGEYVEASRGCVFNASAS